MCNSKVSGIATAGNSTTRGSKATVDFIEGAETYVYEEAKK